MYLWGGGSSSSLSQPWTDGPPTRTNHSLYEYYKGDDGSALIQLKLHYILETNSLVELSLKFSVHVLNDQVSLIAHFILISNCIAIENNL